MEERKIDKLAELKQSDITRPVRFTERKTHRNAKCTCGSGKKYKHCCELKFRHEKHHYFSVRKEGEDE